MLNNKPTSNVALISFAICFLLTNISFAKNVAPENTELENEIIATIKSKLIENTNKPIVDTKKPWGMPTAKNTTVENAIVKTTTGNNKNPNISSASTVAKNTTVKTTTEADTNSKTRYPATLAKNIVVENTTVEGAAAKNTADNTNPKTKYPGTTGKNTTAKTTVAKDAAVENTVVKNTAVKADVSIDSNTNSADITKPKNLNNISSTNEQIKNTKDEIESDDTSEAPAEESNQATKNVSHKSNFKSTDTNINHNHGTKEIPFADNEQINVTLSSRDINRVLVRNDKIQSVNGPTGLYTAKNDATGSAYISLSGSDTNFTIFIATVNGHNLSLLVRPRTIPGRTIILEPTSPSLLPAWFEETESYQKVLVTLITGMINNEALGDNSYTQTKKPKSINFYGLANIREIASYSGARLLGITSEIKNKTKKPVTLKPSYFYRPGVRAVALSKQTIAPSEIGLLYQVIARENQ